MTFQVIVMPVAMEMLAEIADRRIREKILDRIEGLAREPEKQGKPLTGELSGHRSLRAVGQRYRIIYQVDKERVLVHVVAAGIRKEGDKSDIYTLARKLIRLRLLERN